MLIDSDWANTFLLIKVINYIIVIINRSMTHKQASHNL